MKKILIVLSLFILASCKPKEEPKIEAVESRSHAIELNILMNVYEMGYDNGIDYGLDTALSYENKVWAADSTRIRAELEKILKD